MPSSFFRRAGPFTLRHLAEAVEGTLGAAGDEPVRDVATLDAASAGDISFFDNRKYLASFKTTKALACLVTPRDLESCPPSVVAIIVESPQLACAKILELFYPDSLTGLRPHDARANGFIHPSAHLEAEVMCEPGVVVGAGARIGAGTILGAHSVIGAGVQLGKACRIGTQCSVQHAVLGARVILHPGVRLGQDGFGYVFHKGTHYKMPQVGRVVIGDDVEIGSNSTVDRGALRDTAIGAGTKIDNLVQIGHNVVVGAHCVLVGQVGISGSVTLEDYVVIGGQSSVAGHVTIGRGAQIAAVSTVKDDVPPGARYGGVPAKPVAQWFREMTALSQLAKRSR